ncbi:MAG: glycosyltransferase family 4 protein [Chloroflexi bacterium]|nr:glycosyltransferase family 4 protein [Chloroflexota bacterium]
MTRAGASSGDKPDDRLRLLFIARSFPPSLGGMQISAYQLSESIRRQANVTMLVNRRGAKALPAFLPYALASGAYLARRNRVQAIHLGDALLAPLGLALKKITGLPVTSSVHGLDVTYANRLYQRIVTAALAHLDMTMPNSRATEIEVHARVGKEAPTVVIRLGVNPLDEPEVEAIREFRRMARIGPGDRVILTTGRLIKRKGVAWFAGSVLSRLPEGATYVVIGEGPQTSAIRAAASSAGVANRLRLLGRVSDELLAAAYHAADVFVMPNIPVAGDMEGFGLVALEAAASGLPVVAARLEGITEAVQHDRNGLFVTAGSADEYVSTIMRLLTLPPDDLRRLGASYADFTLRTFGWDKTAGRYLDVIGEIAAAKAPAKASND